MLKIIKKKEKKYIEDSPFNILAKDFNIKIDKVDKIIDNYNLIDIKENNLLKKRDNKKEKKEKTLFDTLILWDIENINFYNDFSFMSRYFNNPLSKKIVFLNKERYSNDSFELIKLKKRKWEIKKTSKDADSLLISNFHKYKNKIKKLIIISNDSDFKKIILEAISLNIEVEIIYSNDKIAWFNNIKCIKKNIFNLIKD